MRHTLRLRELWAMGRALRHLCGSLGDWGQPRTPELALARASVRARWVAAMHGVTLWLAASVLYLTLSMGMGSRPARPPWDTPGSGVILGACSARLQVQRGWREDEDGIHCCVRF